MSNLLHRLATASEAAVPARSAVGSEPGGQNGTAGWPNGFAAGTLGIPKPGSGGVAAMHRMSTDDFVQLLQRRAGGEPPFLPNKPGRIGDATWFVTEGNPYTGNNPNRRIRLETRIHTRGQPVQLDEADLLRVRDQLLPEAERFVETQVRQKKHKTDGEPLNHKERSAVKRRAKHVAESRMWDTVGREAAQSRTGVGELALTSSQFSKRGDGHFMLLRDASKTTIEGGAKALLDLIHTEGVPVEPEVLEQVQALAKREGWGGKVNGALRYGGRILIVVGAGADAWHIYAAQDRVRAGAEVAGGWTGAAAFGAATAKVLAPLDLAGPIAWVVHGTATLGAGALGYFLGGKAASNAHELMADLHQQPLTVPRDR